MFWSAHSSSLRQHPEIGRNSQRLRLTLQLSEVHGSASSHCAPDVQAGGGGVVVQVWLEVSHFHPLHAAPT